MTFSNIIFLLPLENIYNYFTKTNLSYIFTPTTFCYLHFQFLRLLSIGTRYLDIFPFEQVAGLLLSFLSSLLWFCQKLLCLAKKQKQEIILLILFLLFCFHSVLSLKPFSVNVYLLFCSLMYF
jgi:hypothetical protein